MFIVSAKLTKKKLISTVAVAGVLLAAAVFMLTNHGTVEASGTASKKLKTNDDRVAYLNSLGWEVEAEPLETQEVIIPEEWDSVFEDYNKMQLQHGFDLGKHKGRRVMRCSYKVTNYPSQDSGIIITLLIYKSSVIGGDIQSPSPDGFMTGLLANTPQSADPTPSPD